MSQLSLGSLISTESKAGRAAPLIHKWFARRRPEAIREVLSGLEESAVDDTHTLRILDPFTGSGMILLESILRGHDVYGMDISPVAWLIARETLDPPDPNKVNQAFGQINDAVGPQIRRLFSTKTPAGEPVESVTAFYVRVVDAFDETDLELHHNFLIARNRKKNWAAYYCPYCSAVFAGDCRDIVSCSECQSRFDWRQGTVSRGQITRDYNNVRLADLFVDEPGQPRFKLIAVESYSEETGRQFHRPSVEDYVNVESAASQCRYNEIAIEFNQTQIPTDRRDARPISHGFRYYGQLFAPRQLLSLALIVEAIKGLGDPEMKYALALALSDAAGNNNRMCRYAADWLKLTPAFGLHGFDVVTRPVEGNVWGASRGRGSFRNCVEKAMQAYSTIGSEVGEVEEARKTRPIREVSCLPAQALSDMKWEPMDAVVTDPPYFDNLDYAELGDFYYQWLRIAMGQEPPFDQRHAIDEADLAAIASVSQDPDRFSSELSRVFRQAVANLKPSGIVAFSYHHTKSQAWECLVSSLKEASLAPFKVAFVRSELENGFHSSTGNIKTDAIFYCRERTEFEDSKRASLLADSLASLEELRAKQSLKPIDLESACLAMAAALAALNPTESFASTLARMRQVAKCD